MGSAVSATTSPKNSSSSCSDVDAAVQFEISPEGEAQIKKAFEMFDKDSSGQVRQCNHIFSSVYGITVENNWRSHTNEETTFLLEAVAVITEFVF